MYDIIVSGYVSMDRIILVENEVKSGHTSIISNKDNSKIYYGGCPVNISYALKRLNMDALPIIKVGHDYKDIGFYDFLQKNEINMDAIEYIEEETTSNCYLIEDKKGNHITNFYPGAMDDRYFKPMNEEWFKNTELGVITVGPLQDNIEFLKKSKKHKLDLVFGAKLDYQAFPHEFLKEVLLYSKIIFLNEIEEREIKKLFGCSLITDLFDYGITEIIVVTLGTKGSVYYQKYNAMIITNHVEILKTDNCVDTTGSGDAYIAGFLYGYLNGYTIEESCYLGSTLAHFVVQQMGCNTAVPTLETLLEKYEKWRCFK